MRRDETPTTTTHRRRTNANGAWCLHWSQSLTICLTYYCRFLVFRKFLYNPPLYHQWKNKLMLLHDGGARVPTNLTCLWNVSSLSFGVYFLPFPLIFFCDFFLIHNILFGYWLFLTIKGFNNIALLRALRAWKSTYKDCVCFFHWKHRWVPM